MINLLPPKYSTQIRFGRRNTRLRSWILGALLAIAGVLVILLGGWLYLENEASQLEKNIVSIESQLAAQNLPKVQKDAKQISGNIKLIEQVLGRQIKFSELIQDVGNVLPSGTILASLNLSSKVDGALDLSANTVDHESAARLAANLGDPKNGLFESVDIVSVKCTTSNNFYKCDAVYRALFSKDAKERFSNGSDR